jgi:hypothetical protein
MDLFLSSSSFCIFSLSLSLSLSLSFPFLTCHRLVCLFCGCSSISGGSFTSVFRHFALLPLLLFSVATRALLARLTRLFNVKRLCTSFTFVACCLQYFWLLPPFLHSPTFAVIAYVCERQSFLVCTCLSIWTHNRRLSSSRVVFVHCICILFRPNFRRLLGQFANFLNNSRHLDTSLLIRVSSLFSLSHPLLVHFVFRHVKNAVNH